MNKDLLPSPSLPDSNHCYYDLCIVHPSEGQKWNANVCEFAFKS